MKGILRAVAQFLLLAFVFMVGWTASVMYMNIGVPSLERPLSLNTLLRGNIELESPQDHISEDNIHVFNNKVVIDVEDAVWSTFTNTNSMDPIIDTGANGLEISPKSPSDINVGDIISYKPEGKNGLVIHRVVATGYDGEGWYARTKGDNNPTVDPGKVRFNQIHGVLIGVIY
jgi:hypothetical protein